MRPTEIFVVCCKDGTPCSLPDHAGSSWEDLRANPYYERAYAEEVRAALDSMNYWGQVGDPTDPPSYFANHPEEAKDRIRATSKKCFEDSYCGPHSIARFAPEDPPCSNSATPRCGAIQWDALGPFPCQLKAGHADQHAARERR